PKVILNQEANDVLVATAILEDEAREEVLRKESRDAQTPMKVAVSTEKNAAPKGISNLLAPLLHQLNARDGKMISWSWNLGRDKMQEQRAKKQESGVRN